jgi:hypothetical protein
VARAEPALESGSFNVDALPRYRTGAANPLRRLMSRIPALSTVVVLATSVA